MRQRSKYFLCILYITSLFFGGEPSIDTVLAERFIQKEKPYHVNTDHKREYKAIIYDLGGNV